MRGVNSSLKVRKNAPVKPSSPGLSFDASFGVFLKDFIYILLEGKEGRNREEKTLMCKRNIRRLPLAWPQLETWPAAPACALTGN